MKEIVDRLKENRDLELAKSILEANGYTTSKARVYLGTADEARAELTNAVSYGWKGDKRHKNTKNNDKQKAIFSKYDISDEESVDWLTDRAALDAANEFAVMFESKKVKGKRLKEARNTPLVLTVSKDSQPIDEDALYDLSVNGIELIPESDDFPMPWDAEINIEDGQLILRGNIAAGGPGRGYAEVGISLDAVSNYISMRIMPNDEEAAGEIRDILTASSWSVE